MRPRIRRLVAAGAAALLLAAVLEARPWAARDWRTADRGSAGISPPPAEHPEAVVQGFAARAVRWRGVFAVHCWISVKEKDAPDYRVYHLVGWRLRRSTSAVVIETGVPDGRWYGRSPKLLFDIRGERAESVIPKIDEAARAYPYASVYRVWPGPNSNTFVSHILRNVPEIGVELPSNAVGRDWLGGGRVASVSESGTGLQLSIYGLAGVTAGLSDGVEINLLGLNFGVDLLRPALKLPLLGRVGLRDKNLRK
ncbi:MAG TPA: DUF3750 domain-containing protein [Elusimicrobiales bacterium]|nr:DUF3750 domain-containing protein [Elusimicrobiales bacterium]